MKEFINIVDYSPEWPKLFKEAAAQLKKALGDNCLEIHHIGSTSVPQLAAKPIIDILPVVKDIQAVSSSNAKMIALGYEPKGELGIPFRRYFQKGLEYRTHHVHVFEKGNPEIDRHLKFRNWMRAHPQDRQAYEDLKRTLAQQFPDDRMAYGLGKEDFISTIDSRAGWNDFRIVIALTPKEWESYHRIREEQLFSSGEIVYDRNHPTMRGENNFHFVLYKGSEIVSVAYIEFLKGKEATLRSLATNEKDQRKGYGRRLLLLLEAWLRHHDRTVLKMHANLRAEDFYRKLGYVEMTFEDVSISKEVVDLGKVLR